MNVMFFFTTEAIQKWGIESLHREEINLGIQKTELVQHEVDKRICWVDEQTNEDPEGSESLFKKVLESWMEKNLYGVIPLPPLQKGAISVATKKSL